MELQTYSRNMSSPCLAAGEMGQMTALSRRIALRLGAGLWLNMGISHPRSSPRLLQEPADPQAPTGWAMLGAVGPRQPESPPISSPQPQQESLAAAGLSFPSGYPGGFRGAWFNRSNRLSYS